MFSAKLRGGKAFSAEQKNCEFKKMLFKIKNNVRKKGKKLILKTFIIKLQIT